MREKGQVLIILAGILALVGMFAVGWLVAHNSNTVEHDVFDLDKFTIHQENIKDGDTHISTIVVDNCKSSVASTTEETRDFAYQQLFSLDISNEFGLDVKNAVYLKLEETFGFESGRVEKVSRNFTFNSPPGKISIHTITWAEELRTGYVQYEEEKFYFTYPVNIKTNQKSAEETCP